MISLQPQVEVSSRFSGFHHAFGALREGLKPSNDWLKLHTLSWQLVTWRSRKDTSPWGVNFTGEYCWMDFLTFTSYAYYICGWFAKKLANLAKSAEWPEFPSSQSCRLKGSESNTQNAGKRCIGSNRCTFLYLSIMELSLRAFNNMTMAPIIVFQAGQLIL